MAGLGVTNAPTTTEIQNNPFLSGLAFAFSTGFEIWNSTGLTFTMNVGDTDPDANGTGTWTTALTDSINYAHAHIEAVSNVTFTEVTDTVNGTDGADIDYWYYNSPSYLGYSYGIGGSGVYINETYVTVAGTNSSNGLEPGGYDYITVIHELLHNMGLSHPFDSYASFPGVTNSSDTGDFALNQNIYTVMSYSDINQVDANGVPTTNGNLTNATRDYGFTTLGAFDVAMLQTLYGANMSTATGNDVYILPTANQTGTFFQALWDAGGIDEIRHNGVGASTIDLRAATLDVADGMMAGGMISRVGGIYGGFTIANGVTIENASGGSGADAITGNDAANLLLGRDGDDTIVGGGANDTLDGGRGDDTLQGGADDDTLQLSEADVGDVDLLDGQADTDTADFTQFGAAVWVDLDYGGGLEGWTRDTSSAQGAGGTWREIADLVAIENVTGSGFNDTLIGDANSNELRGLAGNDLLRLTEAGAGAIDVLDGGSNNDTASFSGFGAAVWVDLDYGGGLEAWTRDTGSALPGGGGTWREIADLINIENVRGTGFDDVLIGDAESNQLRGLAGNDLLKLTDAAAGAIDLMHGGGGTDTADFSEFGAAVWIDLDYGGGLEAWTRDTSSAQGAGPGTWREIADLRSIENLTGSAFHDRLIGDDNANTFRGLGGSDILTGEGDADTFIFDFASDGIVQTATITDFELGIDVLTVNGDSEDDFYGSATFSSMTDGGGPDTTISMSTGDELILEGVTVAEIEAYYASV